MLYVEPVNNLKGGSGAATPSIVPKLTLNKIKVGVLDSYKSRSARPDFQNHNILATESADMSTK